MYQEPSQQQYQPPYQPFGAPPAPFNANKDLEQLKMLSIGHYILGGLTALFGLFPLIYVLVGAAFIVSPPQGRPGDPPPPAAFGWFFVIFGAVFSLILWALAFGTIYAGRQIAKLQKYTFCLIMAGFNCMMFMPLGTILGVFTFIVLLRESVKQLFNGGPPVYPTAPPPPGNIYR
jgi:cellulose synthase/poly-beta-1,6-N-acetylglucosamine synthase-like glycosyltransferase